MKYSKSDSEYFRNKKGGKLEENGKLSVQNFNRNTKSIKIEEVNSSNNKIKPIKIIVVKKSLLKLRRSDNYIFFGYNPETGIYEYVCYVNQDFSDSKSNSGSPITCEKRNDDGTIVKLNHEQFLNIDIRELSILLYNLLLIDNKNKNLIDKKFFMYLLDYGPFKKILDHEIHNKNHMDIVNKIKTMIGIINKNEDSLPKRKGR